MILIAAAAAVAAASPHDEERKMFNVYRDCVLAAAKTVLHSGESAVTIENASRARCRFELSAVEAKFSVDGVLTTLAQVKNEYMSPFFAMDSEKNLARFNRELTEDIADFVISNRLQSGN